MKQITFMTSESPRIIIGVDEAGRGPLFGRVYCAAVILPADAAAKFAAAGVTIKDSKKMSKKKLSAAAAVILRVATVAAVRYEEAAVIDEINIRRANFRAIAAAVAAVAADRPAAEYEIFMDGNDFIPMRGGTDGGEIPYRTIVGGDATVLEISCASILAKTARDEYIADLCDADPTLDSRYDLRKNVGYGTPRHIAGLRAHGPAAEHRITFIRKIMSVK